MTVFQRLLRLMALAVLLGSAWGQAGELTLADIQRVFPEAQTITPLSGKAPAYMVRGERGTLGYAFSTEALAPISAYSGKPINAVVGLGEDGLIRGVDILHHEEPILVIGISDRDLRRFIDQFEGKKSTDRIRVGARGRPGYVGIDGITGATITTMVLASSVNTSVQRVASAYGIPRGDVAVTSGAAPGSGPPGTADEPPWKQLWQDRTLELVVVALALLLLLIILFFQDWLVEHTVLFHRLRVTYLLFTVFFIGFYCSAQLSVINLLAFFHSLTSGFSWDTLLIEPVVFRAVGICCGQHPAVGPGRLLRLAVPLWRGPGPDQQTGQPAGFRGLSPAADGARTPVGDKVLHPDSTGGLVPRLHGERRQAGGGGTLQDHLHPALRA